MLQIFLVEKQQVGTIITHGRFALKSSGYKSAKY